MRPRRCLPPPARGLGASSASLAARRMQARDALPGRSHGLSGFMRLRLAADYGDYGDYADNPHSPNPRSAASPGLLPLGEPPSSSLLAAPEAPSPCCCRPSGPRPRTHQPLPMMHATAAGAMQSEPGNDLLDPRLGPSGGSKLGFPATDPPTDHGPPKEGPGSDAGGGAPAPRK